MTQREVFSSLIRGNRGFSRKNPIKPDVGVSPPGSCPRGERPAPSGASRGPPRTGGWRGGALGRVYWRERVGARSRLGSHGGRGLTTGKMGGGRGDHGGGISQPVCSNGVWGTSANVRGAGVKTAAPMDQRLGHCPIFLAPTKPSYLSSLLGGRWGTPEMTGDIPVRQIETCTIPYSSHQPLGT